MTEPERILAVPRGPDASPEALARFAVELPSGQAAVTIPIRTPPGRRGLEPELRLTYGSVCGPGPFGVGWTLPLISLKRAGERFILESPDGGGGELLALGGGRFRPRADERYARLDLSDNRWRIRERDGRVHELGEVAAGRWSLMRTLDPFGHRVEYRWDKERLVEVRWLDHGRGAQVAFLASVALDYEGARCARLRVLSHAGETMPIRTYHLEHDEAQNGWLLLRRVRVEGHDGSRSESLPPVELGYAPFDPSRRRFVALGKAELAALRPVERPEILGREKPPVGFPRIALDDARVHRVDLSGDGLADLVIVRDRSIVYWPKLPDGGWGEPVRMADAPSLPGFSPERVFLADVDGDGLADLVYVGDDDVRLYINRGGRGWSFGAHIHGTPKPDGAVTMAALPGGSAGVLWSGARPWLLDLSGGARPYLLASVADPLSTTTELKWAPFSTGLPRPVQVVTSLRRGSHTASYVYEGPVWRGGFRGFASVVSVVSEDRRELEAGAKEPTVETRTWFGSDGKSAGRRIKREVRRAGAPTEICEWSWGAPASDSVYGVVMTGERIGGRRRIFSDHDAFGQPRSLLELDAPDDGAWSATLTLTERAGREEPSLYLVDRPARITRVSIDCGAERDVDKLRQSVAAGERRGRLLEDTLHYYDGQAFVGLPLGQVGKYGARVRSERLAFTDEWLHATLSQVPVWLAASRPDWPSEYPKGFRTALPSLGGYLRRPVKERGREVDAWYVVSARRRYDFQEAGATPRGRVTLHRDGLEHDTAVHYDSYELMPAKVSDPRGLATQAAWDYRVLRPKSMVAASGGRLAFAYSTLGLLERRTVYARPADERPLREHRYLYDLPSRALRVSLSDASGETMERVEYHDAQGRLIQVRTAAAEVRFAPLPTVGAPDDAVGQKADRVQVWEPGRAPRDSVGWQLESSPSSLPPAAAPTLASSTVPKKVEGALDLLGRSWGGHGRALALDASGAPVEERDAMGALVLRAFDAAGREVRRWARDHAAEHPSLRVWRIFGDSIESGLPVQRAAEAHLLGRLHRQYDEAGLLVHSAYDSDGNLLERTRQPLSEEAVAAGAVDWQPHGSLSLDTHARSLLDERRLQTQLRWDARGRLIGSTYPQDISGRRHEVRFAHDRTGRVVQVDLDGKRLIEHVSWDAAGRKLLVAWSNGVLQRWARDAAGRVVRLRAERYESVGELRFAGGGGLLQEYWCERDPAGRVVQIIDDSPDAGLAHRSHRLERMFAYDDAGRLIAATGRESGRAPDWPWEDAPRPVEAVQMRAVSDALDWSDARLIKQRHDAGRGSFTREWILDDAGHVTRLIGSDGYLSYQLDGAGRLVQESSVRRFSWDHAGRLARYRWGEDPPQIDAIDRYGGVYGGAHGGAQGGAHDGRGALPALRLVRRAEGLTELIYRDGPFVHEVGEAARSWLHISVGDWRIASARSGPARAGEPEAPLRCYLEDLDGSVALTVDEQGQELSREGYGPLGDTTWGGAVGQSFRFLSAERDSHTGLYVMNGRPYAPWLGRFIDDGTVLPAVDATPDVAVQQNMTPAVSASHFDEIFRIPIPAIVDNRGTEHGERELPHPGPRHRPQPQGGAWSTRGGMGQGARLR